MMLSIGLVTGISLLYIALLFMVAYYADRKQEMGQSIIANPVIYSLSIAVYTTSWNFYGAVGNAAVSGIDFLPLALGPTLTAFSWWFLLRKMVRIGKENNITSLADFISSRYGKSQRLGALVTIIAILGIMPYIALQLKAVSATFDIICGTPFIRSPFVQQHVRLSLHLDVVIAIILGIFGVIFGARHLVSSERHEGLVAAVAVESIVKLIAFLIIGIYVTYFMFDGFTDIFSRTRVLYPQMLDRLTTIGTPPKASYPDWFAMLYLSVGSIILLPRQFHVMVIENSREEHIKSAMWQVPTYLFLWHLFIMPIALGGILATGSQEDADYFVLTLPLLNNNRWLALVAFLGGFSAAAGMVIVESLALSTMVLNHLVMPIVVKFKPRSWFPTLFIYLKRCGIFLVVFLGYFYYRIVSETYTLVKIGLTSFVAFAQFGPALVGGLYWRRGNRTGAITGILFGFIVWFYTLLFPSFIQAGWWRYDILANGPFGLEFLKPTELFGLSGLNFWTHSLFWSMFFNISGYLLFSIILSQDEVENEQSRKFVDVFKQPKEAPWETKRLTKPVTIQQFITLMTKFLGEGEANAAISEYLTDKEIDERGGVSELELPRLKRYIEKTLAGALGAAAAGAVVESFLSDTGARLEPVYDIYSKVRADLKESRENLFVRLRASELMNRTIELQIIMDDLLELICREFKFDLAIIRLINKDGLLIKQSYYGENIPSITEREITPDIDTYIGDAFLSNKPRFINDSRNIFKPESRQLMEREQIKAFAHIPIALEGEPPLGVLSVFSRTITGLFTEQFLNLLSSLAGQLSQAVKIDAEMKAKERERTEKEKILNEMELARQIQLSLLPAGPPSIRGVQIAGLCVPATHVGGDYYDFFLRDENTVEMVIADVSGHSVGAALIMAETRSALRAQIRATESARDILANLNKILYEDLSKSELFITMFYAKYHADKNLLDYASAGHNPPLLCRNGEASCIELNAEGLILGIRENEFFEEKRIELREGDLVLLYTDGVIEVQNEASELFGIERLCTLLERMRKETPEAIIAAIIKEITAFSHSSTFPDDVTAVLLKVL